MRISSTTGDGTGEAPFVEETLPPPVLTGVQRMHSGTSSFTARQQTMISNKSPCASGPPTGDSLYGAPFTADSASARSASIPSASSRAFPCGRACFTASAAHGQGLLRDACRESAETPRNRSPPACRDSTDSLPPIPNSVIEMIFPVSATRSRRLPTIMTPVAPEKGSKIRAFMRYYPPLRK